MVDPVAWLAGSGTETGGDLEVESELRRERAEALGRAGRALADSVAAYREASADDTVGDGEREALLDEVAERLYGLLVQRESAGARSHNQEAVVAAYDVPREALHRR